MKDLQGYGNCRNSMHSEGLVELCTFTTIRPPFWTDDMKEGGKRTSRYKRNDINAFQSHLSYTCACSLWSTSLVLLLALCFLVQASFQLEELVTLTLFLRAEREKMTMTECPNTEMQSFPQQVIVGILVPAGQMGQVGQVGQMGQVAQVGQQVAHFPSYQAVAAPAIYAKPEYMYMPQQMAPMVPQMCPHVGDGNSSFPVTPRSPARQASPEERLQEILLISQLQNYLFHPFFSLFKLP